MQDELTKIEQYLTDAWDMLESMGATIPEQKNTANLAEAIRSIPEEIFTPDLSEPLDQTQLDNLQRIVSAGQAEQYLKLGDEFLVNYGEYVMPFEVVGFADATIEGDKTVKAVNLLAKKTDEKGSVWGASGSTKYSESNLRTRAVAMVDSLDSGFASCLAQTKVQTYSRDGSTDVVYDKLYAPSMAQLGITDTTYTTAEQTTIEGPAFTAYEGAADSKRARREINATNMTQAYWTRSLSSSANYVFGLIGSTGGPGYNGYNGAFRVVVGCNFVGKEGL